MEIEIKNSEEKTTLNSSLHVEPSHICNSRAKSKTTKTDQLMLAVKSTHIQEEKETPSFAQVYENFEKKKQTQLNVKMPTLKLSLDAKPFQPMKQAQKNKNVGMEFANALNAFMQAYAPMDPIKVVKSQNWTKEAQALLNEFERLKNEPNKISAVWPGKHRKISKESGFSSDEQLSNDRGSTTSRDLSSDSDGEIDTIGERLDEWSVSKNASRYKLGPIGRRSLQARTQQCRSPSPDGGYRSAGESKKSSSTGRGSFSKEVNKFCTKSPNFSSKRKMNVMKIPSPIKNECIEQQSNLFYHTLWPGYSPYPPANDSTLPLSEQDMSLSSTISSKSSTGENFQRHKKWITEEILEMIAIRDKLYKRMKKQPSPDIIHMYKKIRNMVVGMTRNAKRSYEKRLEDSSEDQTWRYSGRRFSRSNEYHS